MHTPGRLYPILLAAALCLGLFEGCSQRNSPTAPPLEPGPTPTPTPAPPPPAPATLVLSSSSHPEGWRSSECLTCHQPALLPHHDQLSQRECLGCHGDNGTQPGYQLCVVCHGNPPASGAHQSHVALDRYPVDCDTCHDEAGLGRPDRHRDGVVQVQPAPRWGGSYAAGSCTNVWCHGRGTPHWATDNSLACGACHDPEGRVAIGPLSGQHGSHEERGNRCGSCHAVTPPSHYNGTLDNPTGLAPSTGRYEDTTPGGFNPDGSSGSCGGMASPCHGLSAQWTTTDTCTACHGTPPATGSHTPHTAGPCTQCHAGYPSGHADFQVQVAFDGNLVPGGGSFDAGRCSNLACHGRGLSGGTNQAPSWGQPSTGACGTCHGATNGAPPTSGSHPRHTASSGLAYPCRYCHAAYPAGHVDFELDVAFSGSELPGRGSFAAGRCSDVYCHGGGVTPLPPAGGSNNMPTWGDPSTSTCGSCHGAPGGTAGYPPTGEHDFHVGLLGYPCSTCHEDWPARHQDGTRSVAFRSSLPEAVFSAAARPNEGSCASVSCHWDFPSDVRPWTP